MYLYFYIFLKNCTTRNYIFNFFNTKEKTTYIEYESIYTLDNVDVEPLNLAGHTRDLQEELLHYDHQQSLQKFIIQYTAQSVLIHGNIGYSASVLGWSDFRKN